MKHFLIILTLSLTVTSCVTQRACNRKFPPQVTTITNTVTETILRDTIIYVTLPAEVVTSPGDTVYIDRVTGLSTSRKSTLETTYASSWAQVVNGILLHELEQKESEIEQRIENAIRESSTHTETVKEVVKEVNVLKWWQKSLMWLGVLGVGFVVVRLAGISSIF